jgi:glycosyltransferase involved in cell wall biosynthesis
MTFSVVIPTYNRGDFLKKCLASLVAQTERDFEVLVCDDGSTDNTRIVVDQYRHQLDLKYFLLERSGGPSGPRNHGIQMARGTWICFLDSDDSWAPDKLTEVRAHLADGDLIYHQLKKEAGWIGEPLRFANWEGFFMTGNPIPTSSVCMRRSVLDQVGLFNTDLKSVEDGDLWIRLMRAGARFRYIPKALGFYHWESGHNLATFNESNLQWHAKLLEMHEKHFSDEPVRASAQAFLDFRRAHLYFRERRWKQLAEISPSSIWRVPCYSRKLKMLVALTVGKALAKGDARL